MYTWLEFVHALTHYTVPTTGHVVTGDLTIIRNAKVRALVAKGPSYREQNSINWKLNRDIIKKSISAYKHK